MLYMGQDDVKFLDGTLNDGIAAGLPAESQINTKKPVSYEPKIRTELLVDNDNEVREKTQIVDARNFMEYAKKPLRGSIRIDPEQVLNSGRIKDPAQLNETLSRLILDQTAAVYSEAGLDAAIVWFVLLLSGYDSRLYSWDDKTEPLSLRIAGTNITRLITRLGTSETTSGASSKYKKLGK
jgi:3-mercaptopyruvate sulfurtransferase SseA